MKKLLILIIASLCLAGCGAAGLATSTSKLDVKVGGKDSTLNAKSGAVYYSSMAFTAPGKPDVKTSLHTIYIANFEMDTTGPAWMNKPLTSPDQMRVELQLTGEDGTTKDSPFKVGTYSGQAKDVNGVRFAKINTFADGKQTETRFDASINGEVKITSVSADTVNGEVNLTEGDKSIKGTFTAKLQKK
ncbi:MAG: hypothetical protein ACXW18_05740 [Pyrinomonadaceae bacterium]